MDIKNKNKTESRTTNPENLRVFELCKQHSMDIFGYEMQPWEFKDKIRRVIFDKIKCQLPSEWPSKLKDGIANIRAWRCVNSFYPRFDEEGKVEHQATSDMEMNDALAKHWGINENLQLDNYNDRHKQFHAALSKKKRELYSKKPKNIPLQIKTGELILTEY